MLWLWVPKLTDTAGSGAGAMTVSPRNGTAPEENTDAMLLPLLLTVTGVVAGPALDPTLDPALDRCRCPGRGDTGNDTTPLALPLLPVDCPLVAAGRAGTEVGTEGGRPLEGVRVTAA